MKKNIVAISILLIMVLCSVMVCAQYEEEGSNTNAPPGMIVKKIGGRNVIIPKDSWVREEGGMLVMEDPNEYAARKFMEIEEHLAKIDTDLETMQKELQELKDENRQK